MNLSFFHRISALFCVALLIALTHVSPLAAQTTGLPDVAKLDAKDPASMFNITNGSIAADPKQPGVYLWHIPAGQTSTIALNPDFALQDQSSKNRAASGSLLYLIPQYEKFNLQFRVRSGSINSLGCDTLGIISGPRNYKQCHWDLAIFTTTKNQWHDRTIDLQRPNWFPWDDKDGLGREPFFTLAALGQEPNTVIELRDMSFTKDLIRIKPYFELPITWPVLTRSDDGSATYTTTQLIQNTSGKPATITAKISELPQGYETGIFIGNDKPSLPVKDYPKEVTLPELGPSKTTEVHIVAHLSASQLKALPELAASQLVVTFAAADISPVTWKTTLARPLSTDIKRQVILSDDDLQKVRQAVKDNDKGVEKAIRLASVLKEADDMVATQFMALPRGHVHVRNNYIANWRVTDRMPEIVDTKTGEKQFGTNLAGLTWKEYMANRGKACENLAMAYLYTADEKYADAAARLFALYAQQYSELSWNNLNDAPWAQGPATLGASRVSSGSTYGTNWFFKGHMRLLSAISGSKAWTPELQKRVYQGFVLPYATEIMKFPGPISNMADITNHNVLLLGLVFDDANLVNWALNNDAGVLKRMNDINDEGFGSEGRTVGYHLAGLTESIPSLGYAVRSGLKLKLPIKKLTRALAMPFERAALDGVIPSYGDAGRGLGASPTSLADEVLEIAPDQTWLADIGRGSSLSMILNKQRPDRDAWKKRLLTTPILYPETGFAIMRTGDDISDQIMVTLDWGRSVFHSHLDRNQFTLQAFGKLFSQGPGSLYNAGSGGMVKNPDPRIQSFASGGSLGHNVIMIDQLDQAPAIGNLLAWNGDPAMQVAVSHVAALAPGVDHTRAVVLTQRIIIMLDRIKGDSSHTYDFIYHNLGKLTPGKGWTTSPVTEPLGSTGNYGNLVDLTKLTGQGPVHLVWDLTHNVPPHVKAKKGKDGKEPELPVVKLDLWQLPEQGGTFFTAVTGINNRDTTVMPDNAPSLIQRVQGKTGFFATVLEPNKGESRIASVTAAGDDGVTIKFTDGKTLTVHLDELIKKFAVK